MSLRTTLSVIISPGVAYSLRLLVWGHFQEKIVVMVDGTIDRQTVNSVVVLFKLVAYRRNDYVGGAGNLEQRHIARVAKRNDQFSQKGALASFAAREGRGHQGSDARANRDKRLFGQFEIPSCAPEFPLQNEVEQSLQVSLGASGQADPEVHRRVAGLRARAASNLR